MSDQEPTKEQRFVKNMLWMVNTMEEAEAMTNKELIEALCELSGHATAHVSSMESSIVGEVVYRMQYPLTWRLRRWWNNRRSFYAE